MAVFRPLLGSLSGSIGDNVFSHNKGGPYLRRRAIPTNPNTTKQQSVRGQLSTLSSAWRGLSANQRAEWQMWAENNPSVGPLGDPVIWSGQQAYLSCNIAVLNSGGTRNDDCPVTGAPPSLLTATVVATAPDQVVITYTATPLAAGNKLVAWATLPGSVGRSPNFRQARKIGTSAAAAASPQTITTPYPGLAGQRMRLFIYTQSAAGLKSPPVVVDTTWV